MKRIICISFLLVAAFAGYAQEGVRNGGATTEKPTGKQKILLSPYEPKMYRSEIDQKINLETKWNASQINEYFRKQLDRQLKLSLQDHVMPTLSFYDDSTKMAKDLNFIYKSTAISFDKVGKPSQPTAAAKKQESAIKNGQIEVELGTEQKFSNLRLDDLQLIPYLGKKYSAQYFVFVNELDILTVPESYDLATDSYQREVTVHYTIVDGNSKLLSAGIATSRISSKENNPKKIVSTCFRPICSSIATKLKLAIAPPKANQ